MGPVCALLSGSAGVTIAGAGETSGAAIGAAGLAGLLMAGVAGAGVLMPAGGISVAGVTEPIGDTATGLTVGVSVVDGVEVIPGVTAVMGSPLVLVETGLVTGAATGLEEMPDSLPYASSDSVLSSLPPTSSSVITFFDSARARRMLAASSAMAAFSDAVSGEEGWPNGMAFELVLIWANALLDKVVAASSEARRRRMEKLLVNDGVNPCMTEPL